MSDVDQEYISGNAITCPHCGGAARQMKDSRPREYNGNRTVRRSRLCDECGERFPTLELSEAFIRSFEERVRKDFARKLLEEALR